MARQSVIWTPFGPGTLSETGARQANIGGAFVNETSGSSGVAALLASNVATAAPALGSPAIGQTHLLSSLGLAPSSTTIDVGTFGQSHTLSGTAIATGSPSLGSPAAAQTNAFGVVSIATGAFTLTASALGQTHILTKTDVAPAAPAIAQPGMAQTHNLVALNIATGPAEIMGLSIGPTTDLRHWWTMGLEITP